MSDPTPKVAALTERERKLLDVGKKIGESSAEETRGHMTFIHSVLCQVGLPRSKVEGDQFIRRSGTAWLSVQSGHLDEGKGPVKQTIPYGPLPRLALSWLSSEAVRRGSREVPVGRSAAEFLRFMGMGSDGRRYAMLKKQMHALVACRLQLGFQGRTFDGQPVEQFDAWMPNRDSNQRPLWPGEIVLSEHYFNDLQDSAMPLDNRALHALKGSALALDVYAWLAHRLHRIEGRPLALHWKPIRGQFGDEYNGKDADKDFKKKFLVALKKVKLVYPEAKIDAVKGGLLLISSPPPIPKKVNAK